MTKAHSLRYIDTAYKIAACDILFNVISLLIKSCRREMNEVFPVGYRVH